jgi:hypothetical protein
MPEGFNAAVGVPGDRKDARGRPIPRFEKRITLDVLINWINQQNYDTYTKKELIKKASGYPYTSFKKFADNINVHIREIREKRERTRREKDEREQMSVPMSIEPRVDEGPVAAELPGIECFSGSESEEKEACDGESNTSTMPS